MIVFDTTPHTMHRLLPLSAALAVLTLVSAHGDHGASGGIYDLNMEGIDNRAYAEKHVRGRRCRMEGEVLAHGEARR